MTLQVPNHRRHALEYFRTWVTRQNDRGTLDAYKLHISALGDTEARSFLLPPNGEIISYDTPARLAFDQVRLPFPKCILEYSVSPDWYEKDSSDNSTPTAAILCLSQEVDHILMSVAWRGEIEGQPALIPSGVAVGISSQSAIEIRA